MQKTIDDREAQQRLIQRSTEEWDVEKTNKSHASKESRWILRWIIALLSITNCILLTVLYFTRTSRPCSIQNTGDAVEGRPVLDQLQTSWAVFGWRTPYASPNENEADALWDGIRPSHGIVAVDREWAEERHWPSSKIYPGSHPPKTMYLLEGYHQMHCLTMIRRAYNEARRSQPASVSTEHVAHCYDELRQAIQCRADNTPLYTIGNGTSGLGQIHKCQSWDQLRDFAAANSACYSDVANEATGFSHLGVCGQGSDGLPSMDALGDGDIGPP